MGLEVLDEIGVAEAQPVNFSVLVFLHEPFDIIDVFAADGDPAEHDVVGVGVHFFEPLKRVSAGEDRHHVVAALFHDQKIFPSRFRVAEDIKLYRIEGAQKIYGIQKSAILIEVYLLSDVPSRECSRVDDQAVSIPWNAPQEVNYRFPEVGKCDQNVNW